MFGEVSVCNSLLQGRRLVCVSDSVNGSEVIHLYKGTSYEISKMCIKKMPTPECFHWLSRASRRSTVLLGDAGRLQCLSVPRYSWVEPAKTCFSCYESYRFQKDNLKQPLHVTRTFVSRWWLISLVYLTYLPVRMEPQLKDCLHSIGLYGIFLIGNQCERAQPMWVAHPQEVGESGLYKQSYLSTPEENKLPSALLPPSWVLPFSSSCLCLSPWFPLMMDFKIR